MWRVDPVRGSCGGKNAVLQAQVGGPAADTALMDNFIITLGYGVAALLAVAVLVAAWEDWLATHGTRSDPRVLPAPAPSRVDVNLDTLAASPPPTDQSERAHTVNATLTRLALASATGSMPSAWTETRPMVASGSLQEPERQ